VSRESVRLALLIAALNDLDVRLTDIKNAYLNAPITEKYYVIAGDEFGPELKGRCMKIVRALYGLKSAGAAFRAHLATILRHSMNFRPCEADPDVWMRVATKENGFAYWEYALCYVDDILFISAQVDKVVSELSDSFELKEAQDPAAQEERCLGAMIGQYTFPDGSTVWYMSAEAYLKKAIPTIEDMWDKKLYRKVSAPLSKDYHPEVDTSMLLGDDDAQLYASYIGILQERAVELGRIDLTHSVSLMSRFRAAPCEGHLMAVLHIFGYVKGHLRSKLVLDPAYRDWGSVDWVDAHWKEFYPDVAEPIPVNAPEPRGNEVQVNMFCDAAHATCLATRRSTTGVIIFVNGAPIRWYSKRQNMVESSTFGSEFVALKIAYHKCREECAAGAIRVAFEKGADNCSDGLTKILVGKDFHTFATRVLY
jgi:hypothetical protein